MITRKLFSPSEAAEDLRRELQRIRPIVQSAKVQELPPEQDIERVQEPARPKVRRRLP